MNDLPIDFRKRGPTMCRSSVASKILLLPSYKYFAPTELTNIRPLSFSTILCSPR